MNLGDKNIVSKLWEENMVHVDGKDVEEARGAGRVDGVACAVRLSPSVGSTSQTSLGDQIQHRLVGVVFAKQICISSITRFLGGPKNRTLSPVTA